MDYDKNIRRVERVAKTASCTALALVLSAAPVVINLTGEQGIQFSSAYAKSCFTAGTMVQLANGQLRSIEEVEVGDRVLGRNGRVNVVRGLECRRLGGRLLYRLNRSRAFVTAEHPFMTGTGWKSLNPLMTYSENPSLAVGRLQEGDQLVCLSRVAAKGVVGGDVSMTKLAEETVVVLMSISSVQAPPTTRVYNLLLDGDHTYFADDYLVHNKGGGDDGGSGGGEGGDDGGSGGGEGGDDGGSGGGEGGDDGGSGGGEGGDDGGSGGGEGGDDGGSGGGEGGDDGGSGGGEGESGESGESGDEGAAGESGESGESSESGESGESGSTDSSSSSASAAGASSTTGSGGGTSASGDFSQTGEDLSESEEASAISSGWSG